jgi:hypothetical protein
MNNNNNNNNEYNYRNFLVDDYDSESESEDVGVGDESILDTRWIQEYEKQFINDEYRLFIKTDISQVKFEFYYLDRNKSCVECVVPFTYSLQQVNQISQGEIFSIIRNHQRSHKKYYNFQSLLLYSFDFHNQSKDIVRSLANFIQSDGDGGGSGGGNGGGGGTFTEYTNILSIDIIYFTPFIAMFHEFIGFSVFLYED